jgi:hypothetical protein
MGIFKSVFLNAYLDANQCVDKWTSEENVSKFSQSDIDESFLGFEK